MKNQEEIEAKRLEIDGIRRREYEIIPDDLFKRGELAGAQQVLWWLLGLGMEPVRAILNDAEIAQMKEEPIFPGIEPIEPIVEIDDEAAARCVRCGKVIEPPDAAEVCWFCRGDLCVQCWERYGHCGHPEAEAINERMRAWYEEHGMSAGIDDDDRKE